MKAERQSALIRSEAIKSGEARVSNQNFRLTPSQQADAKYQVESVYGARALEARQAQFDFNADKSSEQNTRAIQRQYGIVSSPEKIRSHIEKLTHIIEENTQKNIREGGHYTQDAKLLETMSYIADALKWFGENARVTLSSLYDDVTKGVDMVIEWKTKRNGKSHITRLGVDLTLLRRGRDSDRDWKLQKKQQGGVMRDPESAKDILLDGALRHLDYFKSQLTHGDWRGKRFVRTPVQGKRIVSRQVGVFVPATVASLENPLDLYRFCGDLFNPDTGSVRDIEADAKINDAAQNAYAHHPMRIALLEATLNGVRAQMHSLEEQKRIYSDAPGLQEQIAKTLVEFRSIRSELEKNLATAKGETIVPFARKEKSPEVTLREEKRKNAFDALSMQESRLRKFITAFENLMNVSLPQESDALEKFLYEHIISDESKALQSAKMNKSDIFDAQYDRRKSAIEEYEEILQKAHIQDSAFQNKISDVRAREEMAKKIIETMDLVREDFASRVA
ncbi:hypothetical protein HY621_02950 [Candidatus Uhrbacteria bacterium]|nr:hypothetical protein [Candidatus Uhrbacteria bacterium]